MTLIETIGQELIAVLKRQTEMLEKMMERLDEMDSELSLLSGQLADVTETVEDTKWILKGREADTEGTLRHLGEALALAEPQLL